MKKIFWLVIALLVLASAGVFWWIDYKNTEATAKGIRKIIPANAALLFSTTNLGASWDSLQQKPLWQAIEDLPGLQRMEAILSEAKELEILKQLEGKEVTISLHPTERYKFDWIVALPMKSVEELSLFTNWQKRLTQSGLQVSKRNYRNAQLFQISLIKDEPPFTLLIEEGMLIGSFTPYLVEEVARRLAGEEGSKKLPTTKAVPLASENIAGKLEVFWPNLPELLGLFVKDTEEINRMLPGLPYASQLDMLLGEDGTLLTGFTERDGQQDSVDFLWALHQQKPQRMTLTRFVPQRAASLMFLGLNNAEKWHKQLQQFWQRQQNEQFKFWQASSTRYPVLPEVIRVLDNEIGLATIPNTVETNTASRLLVASVKNGSRADSLLQILARKMAQEDNRDSAYQELYSGHLITQFHRFQLPEVLFGSAFWGFNESYYLMHDNYLIIGNSVQALRDMLADIEAEETWQRSLTLNRYLSRLEAEFNYGLYVQTDRFLPFLVQQLSPEWKSFWSQHAALKQFDLLSAQLTATQNSFYTNVFVHYQDRPVQAFERIRLTEDKNFRLQQQLVSLVALEKPQQKLLIQTSDSTLAIIEGKNKSVLVQAKIKGIHLGELELIKAKNNQKDRYLLATDSLIYLLDDKLEAVSPFPVSLPEGVKIKELSLVDYSGDGFYRILAADASGGIYMYDMDGINLQGWNPFVSGSALVQAPKHARIRNKDIIYTFTQKGQAIVVNRRGEPYPGFPLTLKDDLLGPVIFAPGSDFSSSRFTTITANGWMVSFNLEGEILSRKQLYRPDPRARFFVVPDQKQQSFLIAQQDRFNLRFLDSEGRDLFEKDYLGAEKLAVSFYYFSGNSGYVVVNDPDQEFAYIYSMDGVLFQNKPLNSSMLPILYSSNTTDSVNMVKAYDQNLTWSSFLK